MWTIGSIAFATPWILSALATLPVILWLMRITPPAPRRIDFPAVRLLFGLQSPEEAPAKSPLWLLILRAVVAVLIVVALAHPILNPGNLLSGEGTVVLVVDDGWASAERWQARQDSALNLVDRAERSGRPLAVLTTAAPNDGSPLRMSGVLTPGDARDFIQGLKPKAWPVDRAAAAVAIETAKMTGPAEVFWLSDGVTGGRESDAAEAAAKKLADAMGKLGTLHVLADDDAQLPMTMAAPGGGEVDLQFVARRASTAVPGTFFVRASADRGQLLARQEVSFAAGATEAPFTVDLPAEVRNRIVRVEIEGQNSAGAVSLLDERWRRRPVGLVTGEALEAEQPLLSGRYFLERALSPFADVRNGTIAGVLQGELSVLMMADVGKIVGPDRARLEEWLTKGGVLVRFAGPNLANENDDFVPVKLRAGERSLGGAMTWTVPAKLAPFPENSPFLGLALPPDVHVTRQVLAEPTVDLGDKTWARLEDGTPLVTAAKRGQGWIVLFHTTANTDWSDLPLSGLFVDMLRSLVRLSQGVVTQPGKTALPPLAALDGFGRLTSPGAAAQPLIGTELATLVPGPRHPPGYYGTDDARQSFNLGNTLPVLRALPNLSQSTTFGAFNETRERNLMPWLLTAALLLALGELIASLGLRGLLRFGPAAMTGVLLLAVLAVPHPAQAQQLAPPMTKEEIALDGALQTHLAYIETGNPDVDRMSAIGLLGLTRVMAGRTAVEAADPVGVNPEEDELVFFPLLYWPMTAEQKPLSEQALARVDAYMKNGGTILFDTRDGDTGGLGNGVGMGTQTLQRLLGRLDVPPLVPIPEDHVLTQSFYLLQDFPGRWDGSRVWVVQHPGGVNDGVSSIIVGSNDWASAWALDKDGWPIAPVSSGNERQREFAFRFGINLVMYVLTGNYKADQVHLPAIMDRIGQ